MLQNKQSNLVHCMQQTLKLRIIKGKNRWIALEIKTNI
jgi:hypothetical protein